MRWRLHLGAGVTWPAFSKDASNLQQQLGNLKPKFIYFRQINRWFNKTSTVLVSQEELSAGINISRNLKIKKGKNIFASRVNVTFLILCSMLSGNGKWCHVLFHGTECFALKLRRFLTSFQTSNGLDYQRNQKPMTSSQSGNCTIKSRIN